MEFSDISLEGLNNLMDKEKSLEDYKDNYFLNHKRNEDSELFNTQKIWTDKEDILLKESFFKYENPNDLFTDEDSFCSVNNNISNLNNTKSKSKKYLNVLYKKGKWSEEEDKILYDFIMSNGPKNWSKIKPLLQGRTNKQIRERYKNHISLLIKDKSINEQSTNNKTNNNVISKKNVFNWNNFLDNKLLEFYILFGSSWVYISKLIKGTSENIVKNRFYSILRKFLNRYKKNCTSNKESSENPSYKEMILNHNPYITCSSKSLKKNYSLKILLDFLPDLLKEKGIDPEDVKRKNKELLDDFNNNKDNLNKIDDNFQLISESVTYRQNKAIEIIFSVIGKHLEKLKKKVNKAKVTQNKKREKKLINPIKNKNKSSCLLEIQTQQLGHIVDKLEYELTYKYFEKLKKKVFSYKK